MHLYGRDAELGKLRAAVEAARAGDSTALAVHGEPGVGKSALLRRVAADNPDVRVVSVSGVEPESGLALAGLTELFRALESAVAGLPGPQREAVDVVLGLDHGPPPEPLLLGLTTLSLWSIAAAGGPVVCIVDDLHWLDPTSRTAVLFALRRLGNEGVAVIVAHRSGTLGPELRGIPDIGVRGIDATAATQWLADLGVAPAVAEELCAGLGGNPLAMVEATRRLDADQRSGRRPLPRLLDVGGYLEHAYLHTFTGLPDATRQALLVLAALGGRDDERVLPAAFEALSLDIDALAPAEAAGLVTVSDRIPGPAHPVVRTVIYNAASEADRRRVHLALAEAGRTVGAAPLGWLQHLVDAHPAADAGLADQLHEAAVGAAGQGDLDAAHRLFAGAAELSVTDGDRARRLLDAGMAAVQVGHDGDPMLAEAARLAPDPGFRADAILARATVAGWRGADTLFLDLLERHVPELGDRHAAALLALGASWAWRHGSPRGHAFAVDSVRRIGVLRPSPDPVDLLPVLFEANRLAQLGERAGAVALCESAMAMLGVPSVDSLGPVLVSGLLLADRCEDALAVLDDLLRRTRCQSPALATWLLAQRSLIATRLGRFDEAEQDARVALDLGLAAAVHSGVGCALAHLQAASTFRNGVADVMSAQPAEAIDPIFAAMVTQADAVAALARGDADQAFVQLSGLFHRFRAQGVVYTPMLRIFGDLVEAAATSGHGDEAVALLDALPRAFSDAFGDRDAPLTWAMLSHARLVTGSPDELDDTYHASPDADITGIGPLDRARIDLLYGERLRRLRRVREARAPLRRALDGFVSISATVWAERAQRELRAAGGGPSPTACSSDRGVADLSTRERQVAELAAAGRTNIEIAESLYVSVRTVESHLASVYRKMGVRSRTELTATLLRSRR